MYKIVLYAYNYFFFTAYSVRTCHFGTEKVDFLANQVIE